jgi:hypothetical protein
MFNIYMLNFFLRNAHNLLDRFEESTHHLKGIPKILSFLLSMFLFRGHGIIIELGVYAPINFFFEHNLTRTLQFLHTFA